MRSDYSSISAGDAHSLGLKTDGTYAWGSNYNGQLGNGSNVSTGVPGIIGTGYAAIAAGYDHSIGLKADGTLWTWGSNHAGQLGNATTVAVKIPTRIK
jgi:alpha-tubulin suppressor-like RCC1 family protein